MADKGLIAAAQSGPIQKAEAAIDKLVPPAVRTEYQQTVQAGLKILFDKRTFGRILGRMEAEGKYDKASSALAISILMILFNRAKMKLRPESMVPAGQVLALNILDYLDKAGLVKADNALIASTARAYFAAILPIFGVTPEKFKSMVGGALEMQKDPAVLAKIKEVSNGAA